MNKYKKQIGLTAVILLVLIICISGALICKRQKKKQENHTSPTENISESVITTKPSETGKTKNPTQKSTESTENATKESTSQASTEVSTEATTEAPTEASTQAPTEAPTEPPTEAPTEAPTEPVTEPPTAPPTQPKRGENGVITVELFGHNKLGAYPIPKTQTAMAEYLGKDNAGIAAWVGKYEQEFFGDGLILGEAKKEYVASLYGEPLYYYTYTNPNGIEMGYQYGYYTDNPDEKIYILFQFKEELDDCCFRIMIGSAYNLNIKSRYSEIN